MMKKIAVAASLLLAMASARADYVIKDGNGAFQTIKAFTLSGNIIGPGSIPMDQTGAALGVAANPLAMSFGTGVLLPAFAATPAFKMQDGSGNPLSSSGGSLNVICTSGCSGGGGGGAVFGPTAAGSAAANPPVLMGGTSDGSGTGLVSPWKVLSGVGFINCANCSGAGISVGFGASIGSVGTPNGFKDGSGNFQPILGDVTNGQWVSIKASTAIGVTGTFWQTTQPVSGTFWQATQPISAASLPLPAGAATQTTLASILTALGSPFQAGASIANTSFGISGTLPAFASTPTVNIGTAPSIAVTGTFWPYTLGQQVAGSSVPIVLTAAQLATLTPPAAQANFALETGGNLASIATSTGRIPAQGQALSAASMPVVLPAAQITTLTPPAAITGFALAANQTGGNQKTQIVDGSGNVIASTSNNLNVQCANCSGSGVSTGDEATFTAGTSLFAGSGGFFQTTATSNPLTSGQQGLFQVTANRALFTNLRSAVGVELGVAAAPLQVSLANTGANGAAILVTGTGGTFPVTGTFFQSTQPVSAVSLPLPAGAATQTTLASLLTALGTPFQAGASIGNTSFAATQATAANLNATVVGTGTFAVQASIASASAWGVNTLGSTTSGQSGQLALGAVTTAAPTYVTAQTNALSLTTGGLLRVDGSGVTQPVSLASTTITGTVAVTQSGSWSLAANQSVNVAQVLGSAISATNGLYSNLLQGNAVLSQTNPIFSSVTDGTNKAAVKAASTNAASTDTALVADPRPNSAATISGSTTNPTSTLTLPATTTAYTAGQLACTSATAGTCNTALASTTFAIANSAGGASISRLRLSTNDTTSTAWAGQTIQIDLWTAAPTFTNGDRGTWLPATGSASHLATFACTFPTPVWGDGLGTECQLSVGTGNSANAKLGSGTSIFWSLDALTGSGVTGASKVFTLTAELAN
jgi:hypothetical protein